MKHSFNENRSQLIIEIDNDEREIIREYGEEMHFDAKMYEFFEPLTCYTELDWVRPEWAGDLTDAPMLGIIDYEGFVDEDKPKVIERWAFMSYQIKSVLEELLNNGRVVFVS